MDVLKITQLLLIVVHWNSTFPFDLHIDKGTHCARRDKETYLMKVKGCLTADSVAHVSWTQLPEVSLQYKMYDFTQKLDEVLMTVLL